tara:strand:- start:714 stop:1481 length:768 start_codon:yes stop_codon:yes gene_type:complete
MEIIPAIDLLDGNCVRLKQGDYTQVTEFNCDPKQQALIWQEKGAERLHLVDLDGAKTGKPVNDKSIREITSALDIPVQIGGGIRNIQRAKELLNFGLDKIILGTIAIENPHIVNELADKYPGRIIVGIDAKNGKVATRGWISQSSKLATDLTKEFSNQNIAAIISTDISSDGTLNGPSLNSLKEVASASSIPIIASGGIGSIADILSLIPLEAYGVIGIIIGRALYDGTIQLEDAIKALRNRNLKDINSTQSYIA